MGWGAIRPWDGPERTPSVNPFGQKIAHPAYSANNQQTMPGGASVPNFDRLPDRMCPTIFAGANFKPWVDTEKPPLQEDTP